MSATTTSAALTKPHFFQPLIPGFEDRFCIPVSFFNYLKGIECDKLTLRSPCGKVWPIKINGRQFTDGWKQFVLDLDLHIGDFLMFRHEGGLVFDFVVFERSTCEREYSPFIPVQEEESEDPPFVPVKGEVTENQQENAPIDTSSGKKLKRKKQAKAREYPPFIPMQEDESEDPPFVPVKEEETEIQQENVPVCTSSGKKRKRKKKVKTRVKVKASSVLENPNPNCVIKLTPDSIKKNRLLIPRKFARENDLYGRSCKIILKDEEANCWRGSLMYSKSDQKLMISAGWNAYHRVHKLKAGESLMVELMKKGEMPVFQIRKLQEHSDFTWEPTCQNNAKAFEIPEVVEESGSASGKSKKYEQTEAISEAGVKKCFFVAKITPATYKASRLYIPMVFSRQHLHNKNYSQVILKDQEGRSWPAKLYTFSNVQEQVRITDGWKEFSSANELKPEDSFVFEFIENGNRPVFKLYGYEAFSGKKQAAALPHFYVNMQIFYNRNSQKIPKNFAERHGLGECSAVTIKNEIGKSWLVSLTLDHKTNEVYMTRGWIEFVRENGIQGEDVFMLELVKGGTRPEMRYYGLNRETESTEKSKREDLEDVKPII